MMLLNAIPLRQLLCDPFEQLTLYNCRAAVVERTFSITTS